MVQRPNAVQFRGKWYTLIGPQLKVGDRAPAFACVNSALEIVGLDQTSGKPRLFSVVPSLDTPVCNQQTKKFEESLADFKGQITCYTISLDLPFAQRRFCTTEHLSHMHTLSDVHDHSFGQNYGVLIEGLAIPLLSRAVFVLDRDGRITYLEYVAEIAQHPNYDDALAALRGLA